MAFTSRGHVRYTFLGPVLTCSHLVCSTVSCTVLPLYNLVLTRSHG